MNDRFVFRMGDGTDGYFTGAAAYPDRDVGGCAWRKCRRDVWALEHRLHVPGAAEVYDGLTCRGWQTLWDTWQQDGGPRRLAVIAALDGDRQAVAAFRRTDPRGAHDIGDYLDLFLADLAAVAEETTRIVTEYRTGIAWPNAPHAICSAQTYGQAVADQP